MIRPVKFHFPDPFLASHPVQKFESKRGDFGFVSEKKTACRPDPDNLWL
jgi:hypothetical protein